MVWLLNANICMILAIVGSTAYGNEDTNYTATEKKSLKEFRETVSDLLYLDYQKEDSFLISWLRSSNLDQNQAKELITNSFKWRKENGIDSILQDDRMIKLENIFPQSLDGVDKEGRPILTLHFQSWDLRKAFVAGKGKDLTRYLDYLFEKLATRIRTLANSTQTDITQGIIIIDMNGYSLTQHACSRCFGFYLDLIQHYDRHYPHKLKYGFIINASRGFSSLLNALKRIIPSASQELSFPFSIYGLDKAEWSPVLLSIISPDQLPVSFGGSRAQNSI